MPIVTKLTVSLTLVKLSKKSTRELPKTGRTKISVSCEVQISYLPYGPDRGRTSTRESIMLNSTDQFSYSSECKKIEIRNYVCLYVVDCYVLVWQTYGQTVPKRSFMGSNPHRIVSFHDV